MTVEFLDLVSIIALNVGAVVDSALDGLGALYAAGAPGGVDPGPLVAGTAAGGIAGGAAAAGGDRGSGDRGFRYTPEGGATVYDSPTGGTSVGQLPAGGRYVYDGVVRDSNGNPTHYHVNPPGGTPGYVPAGDTVDTRPTVAPPPRPSVVIDSGIDLAKSSSAQTAGSRT